MWRTSGAGMEGEGDVVGLSVCLSRPKKALRFATAERRCIRPRRGGFEFVPTPMQARAPQRHAKFATKGAESANGR